MNMETILVLLVLMSAGYVLVSYSKLIKQNTMLKKLSIQIEAKNSDTLRREHNTIARDYNNTLNGFIGKHLAKKLNYERKEIIEKM